MYTNRRRIRGNRGKALHKKRCELVERSFAHTLETGAMRRAHVRGHDNIRKRYLIHLAAFDLGLVMRKLTGCGKPKGRQGRLAALFGAIRFATDLFQTFKYQLIAHRPATATYRPVLSTPTSATGC